MEPTAGSDKSRSEQPAVVPVYGTAANPAQNPQTGLNWTTDALDGTGQLAYPAGTYTVWAESYMNGMMDNYLSGGASYTGKTVAQTQTITLVSNTV